MGAFEDYIDKIGSESGSMGPYRGYNIVLKEMVETKYHLPS